MAHLFELMHTVETPRISSVRASFFPEACRVTSKLHRLFEILLGHPLVGEHGGKWLLRSRNEVLVLDIFSLHHLVQLLIELLQLCSLGHVVGLHKERGLDGIVVAVRKEMQAIVDEGLVEQDPPLAEEVATMTDQLHASVWIVDFSALHDFVVGKAVFLLDGVSFGSPLLGDLVEIFIIVDGDGVMDIVANGLAAFVAEFLLLDGFLFNGFLLLLELDLFLEEFSGVLFVLDDVSGGSPTSSTGRTFLSWPISF